MKAKSTKPTKGKAKTANSATVAELAEAERDRQAAEDLELDPKFWKGATMEAYRDGRTVKTRAAVLSWLLRTVGEIGYVTQLMESKGEVRDAFDPHDREDLFALLRQARQAMASPAEALAVPIELAAKGIVAVIDRK